MVVHGLVCWCILYTVSIINESIESISRPRTEVTLCVFKVTGETNTDDLSPAPDAWSRPDIPLHALAMLPLDVISKIYMPSA